MYKEEDSPLEDKVAGHLILNKGGTGAVTIAESTAGLEPPSPMQTGPPVSSNAWWIWSTSMMNNDPLSTK